MSSDIKDPYTLAITSYALSLVGSAKKIRALSELRKLATEKGEKVYSILKILFGFVKYHQNGKFVRYSENLKLFKNGIQFENTKKGKEGEVPKNTSMVFLELKIAI